VLKANHKGLLFFYQNYSGKKILAHKVVYFNILIYISLFSGL